MFDTAMIYPSKSAMLLGCRSDGEKQLALKVFWGDLQA